MRVVRVLIVLFKSADAFSNQTEVTKRERVVPIPLFVLPKVKLSTFPVSGGETLCQVFSGSLHVQSFNDYYSDIQTITL